MTTLDILIVEDHDSLRQMMADYLCGCGFVVREADSMVACNKALLHSVPHVLLLDLNLPDADGLDFLNRLRQTHATMGVIVITARHKGVDRERAYVQGADVFLKKPFDPAELVAVVQSLGRRVLSTMPSSVHAPLVLMAGRGLLQVVGGSSVRLGTADARLLQVLAVAPGQGLGLDDILQSLGVQSPQDKDRQRLRTHVHRLRHKLSADANMADIVQSVHGVGYRLAVPVQVI